MINDTKQLVEVPYQHFVGNKIQCDICPLECKLGEADIGICGGRQVVNGRLYAINYGQVCTLNLDPIEKKPLYHFYPGSDILSVGPNGCNLSCKWCQNWRLHQECHPTRTIQPNELADMVDALDGIGVAYTYAEPLIWYEFVRDAGSILHERGLVNAFISNGYINPDPLREILQIADAFNIDLKSHDDNCYKHFCGGKLEDVQRTIRMIFEAGKHLEITHLMVTGVSDQLDNLKQVVNWIASLDPAIPLHLTRYFPTDKFNEPPTDVDLMQNAYDVAREKLDWVYLGNLWIDSGQNSICPSCGELLVDRSGDDPIILGLNGKLCRKCGAELNFLPVN